MDCFHAQIFNFQFSIFNRDDVENLCFLHGGEFAVFELGGCQAGATAAGNRGDFWLWTVLFGNQAGDCAGFQINNDFELAMESGGGQRRSEFRGGNYPVGGKRDVGEIKGI